jgi:hypothetical protein
MFQSETLVWIQSRIRFRSKGNPCLAYGVLLTSGSVQSLSAMGHLAVGVTAGATFPPIPLGNVWWAGAWRSSTADKGARRQDAWPAAGGRRVFTMRARFATEDPFEQLSGTADGSIRRGPSFICSS